MIKKTITYEYENGETVTYQEFVDEAEELGDIDDELFEEKMELVETLLDNICELDEDEDVLLDRYLDELTELVHSMGGTVRLDYMENGLSLDVRF